MPATLGNFTSALLGNLKSAFTAHDFQRAATVGGGQNDPGARHMFLRTVTIPDDLLETATIFGRNFKINACSHPKSMNQFTAFGNPPNASLQ